MINTERRGERERGGKREREVHTEKDRKKYKERQRHTQEERESEGERDRQKKPWNKLCDRKQNSSSLVTSIIYGDINFSVNS